MDSSGGRVVAGSNPVIPTEPKQAVSKLRHSLFWFYTAYCGLQIADSPFIVSLIDFILCFGLDQITLGLLLL